MTGSSTHVFDFVFYSIAEEKYNKFAYAYQDLKKAIKNIEGNIEYKTYESIDDNFLFLDFCIWDGLENAKKADELVQNSELFSRLFDPIQEILFFDHLILNDKWIKTDNNYTIIELNLYVIDITKKEKYLNNKRLFYNIVKKNARGFCKVLTFESLEDKNIFVDLMFWETLEDANSAHIKFNENENFIKMKSCVEELKFWVQFENIKNSKEKK